MVLMFGVPMLFMNGSKSAEQIDLHAEVGGVGIAPKPRVLHGELDVEVWRRTIGVHLVVPDPTTQHRSHFPPTPVSARP